MEFLSLMVMVISMKSMDLERALNSQVMPGKELMVVLKFFHSSASAAAFGLGDQMLINHQ